MVADFLPDAVKLLTDNAAINIIQNIKRELIYTPLIQRAIATAYVRQGEGNPPILLLHGFDSSLLEFRQLLPRLATDYQTWAIDLSGFGFTERIPEIAYNPNTIKTHLYYFWKTLIKQPLILIGASMGGAAAIDFTFTYPDIVKKLVLINSVGFSGDFAIGKFLFPPLDYLAVEYWRQRKLQALFWGSKFGIDSTSVEAIRCSLLHLDMPNWDTAMISFMQSGGYSDLGDKINHINQQTLILWGALDDTLNKDDPIKFKQAIAHSQLVWLKNCGHVPQLEQPDIITEHILEFISGQ